MKNICVFGDSLVYGMGGNQEGGWVSQLQKETKDKFIFWNFGIPGDTTRDLLERIEEECEEITPDVAIVLIGANDSQYQNQKEKTLIDIKEYKQNLEKIFNTLKKHTSEIIFIGLPNMNEEITANWDYIYHFCNDNLKRFDKEIQNFCLEKDLRYIPIFDLLNKDDLSDGAHPNDIGYKKIADKVFKNLIFIIK